MIITDSTKLINNTCTCIYVQLVVSQCHLLTIQLVPAGMVIHCIC